MDEQPTLRAEIRASLPPVAQAYVAFLEEQIAVLRDQVTTLQMAVTKLQGQLADAQVRKPPHSGNSSRPPSSDPPDAPPRPKHPPSGRKRGGQPGHPGHARLWLQNEDLTRVVVHRATQCPGCTLPLTGDLPSQGELQRHQVWEIPPITPEVTEHHGYAVRCPHCQVLVPAPGLPTSAFGPRLTAIGSVLHGRYRLSIRETAGVIEDIVGVPIGVGTIPTLCQETSTALEDAVHAVAEQVTSARHANVDETGWKQEGARRGLWTAVTKTCTLFRIATRRNAAVLPTLLGESFAGIVSSDRFGVYRIFPVERRQVCLAHLKRNLTAFAERGGEVGEWGRAIRTALEKVFVAWHHFTDAGGGGDRAPLQAEIHNLLQDGTRLPSWQARTFCADVVDLEPALWTFVREEGVEPTNNAAERALRPAVLWRKGCFGADSDDGNIFVARILTVRETCRQQKKHLLSFLTEAIAALRHGRSPPLLLVSP